MLAQTSQVQPISNDEAFVDLQALARGTALSLPRRWLNWPAMPGARLVDLPISIDFVFNWWIATTPAKRRTLCGFMMINWAKAAGPLALASMPLPGGVGAAALPLKATGITQLGHLHPPRDNTGASRVVSKRLMIGFAIRSRNARLATLSILPTGMFELVCARAKCCGVYSLPQAIVPIQPRRVRPKCRRRLMCRAVASVSILVLEVTASRDLEAPPAHAYATTFGAP